MRVDGEVRGAIAREIVRLQAKYYGQGATRAKVSYDSGVLVVVVEETFTEVERMLLERGEVDLQDIRRRFHDIKVEEFTAVVEQATGRKVRSFLSETDLESDISVEVFILADGRTDMTAFEPGQTRAGHPPRSASAS